VVQIETMLSAISGFGGAAAGLRAGEAEGQASDGFAGDAVPFAVWLSALLGGPVGDVRTAAVSGLGTKTFELLRLAGLMTGDRFVETAADPAAAFAVDSGDIADATSATRVDDPAVIAQIAAAFGLSAPELTAWLAAVQAWREANGQPAADSYGVASGVGVPAIPSAKAGLEVVSLDSAAGNAAAFADVPASSPDGLQDGRAASQVRIASGVATGIVSPTKQAGAEVSLRQATVSAIAHPHRDADGGRSEMSNTDAVRHHPLARLEWLAAKAIASRSAVADVPVESPVVSNPTSHSGADETGSVPISVETPHAYPIRDVQSFFAPQTGTPALSVTRFAFEMAQWLVSQWKLKIGGHVQEARLRLEPDHLGALDVRLSLEDGRLTARFLAETGQAKDLIEAQLGALRSALAAHGIQVGKLEVSVFADAGSTRLWADNGAQSPLADDGRGGAFFGGRPSGRHGWNPEDAYEGPDASETATRGVSYLGWGQSTFEASA